MLTAFPKCWHRSILVAIKTEHQRRFLIWSPSRDALKERTGRVIPPGRQLCSYKTICLTRKAFFCSSHILSLSRFFRELSLDLTERCVWLQAEPSALFFSTVVRRISQLKNCRVKRYSRRRRIQRRINGLALALFHLSSRWTAKYKPYCIKKLNGAVSALLLACSAAGWKRPCVLEK